MSLSSKNALTLPVSISIIIFQFKSIIAFLQNKKSLEPRMHSSSLMEHIRIEPVKFNIYPSSEKVIFLLRKVGK